MQMTTPKSVSVGPTYGRLLIVSADPGEYGGLADAAARSGTLINFADDSRAAAEMLAVEGQDTDVLLVDLAAGDASGGGSPKDRMAGLPDHLPIIVILDEAKVSDLPAYLAAGADDFLVKPLRRWPVVLARIEGAAQRRRLAQLQAADHQRVRELQRHTRDLTEIILPLGVALSAEKDFDRLLERILLEAKAICNADAGTLYLPTEAGDALRFAMVHTTSLGIGLGGTTGKPIALPNLPCFDPKTGKANVRNVASYVALEGRSVNIPDIYADQGFDFAGAKDFDRQNNYRSISNLTVPLKDPDGRVIGVLQLLNAQDRETGEVVPFDAYAQQVVESLASQAAVAMTNQMLLERQQKLVKIEREMEIARQIQTDFLPKVLEQPAGWQAAALFYPAREVAGDFYDVFRLPNQHLCLVVADVADKGVGAALFMALIRSLIRAFSEDTSALGLSGAARTAGINVDSPTGRQIAALTTNLQALNTVVLTNDYLIRNHIEANMFATAFFGLLDPRSGLLTYVNAGHNPPMIRRASGQVERLQPTGPALGMFPGTTFIYSQVQLDEGDTLYTFTDGVTEARGPDGAFFTEKPLLQLLVEPVTSASALADQVMSQLWTHIADADQFDDITMLVLRRTPVQ